MKSDSLRFWEAERERVASGIRADRISTQDGTAMLADIDARIAEHAHGIVPETEAEELPPSTVAVSNVTPLRPGAAGHKAALLRQREIRDRALAKYRRDFKSRTGRDYQDVGARVGLSSMRFGGPMLVAPLWLLDSEVGRNA